MKFAKVVPYSVSVAAVVSLVDLCFDADRDLLRKDIHTVLESPGIYGDVYGLWDGEVLVGCLCYGRCYAGEWAGEGYISHLAVRPEFRRRGLATYMVDKAIADLKASGAPCVCMTVKVGSVAALSFWQRYGVMLYDPAYESDGYGMYESYVRWFGEGDDDYS